jgi:D-glycero-alpha-D-manno-heptose-7-phosphate kinase
MDVIASTREFVKALAGKNYKKAAGYMNRETGIRRQMTPDVLDKIGRRLADIALQNDCGVRFTGAGGGGCLWAIGEIENIDRLRPLWQKSLSSRKEACLLDVGIDSEGVVVD